MNLKEAVTGKEIPEKIQKSLTLVTVPYFSFDKESREGQLVVHTELVEDVEEIFHTLYKTQFPIAQMVPIAAYGWDDDASMRANNSSAFNYRLIFGTERLSNHSFGRAIDINPMQNPYRQRNGILVPPGAQYDLTQEGTITKEIADIFISYGWEWGGNWEEQKDWQHFQKTLE